jgi:hypothetical protein
MKKSFVLITLILMAFAIDVSAQYVVTRDLGTLANNAQKNAYFDLQAIQKTANFAKVDSIVVTLAAIGEIDIDTLHVFPGVKVGNVTEYATGQGFTVTINKDSAETVVERLLTSNAGVSGVNLRGYSYLKVWTKGAAAGNDATDPNRLYLVLNVYGTR